MKPISEQAAARIALACLDLTSLNDGDDAAAIEPCARGRRTARRRAAVCVWPRFVAQAEGGAAGVDRGGGGRQLPRRRARRGARAARDAGHRRRRRRRSGPGAALARAAAGDAAGARRWSRGARAPAPARRSSSSSSPANWPAARTIRQACRIGLDAGVDFLKTSTGKTPRRDARAAACDARSHRRPRESARSASRPRAACAPWPTRRLHRAGARDAGRAALAPQRLRFGASGLLADIESVLLQRAEPAAPQGSY